MDIKLNKPFAANSAVDEADVRLIKTSLNRLGYYQPSEKTGMTGIPDTRTFAALKAFQKDQGLTPTGAAKPGDKTVEALNSATSTQQDGSYIWRTARDDKVRPAHEALEGTIRRWGDSPAPGDEYNCRCWAEPVSDDNTIEREELPPPRIDEPKIPGTDIPDRGIPEQGYPGYPKYDPYRDDGRQRTIPPRSAQPPNPKIDPGMEIPYDPMNPSFFKNYRNV